MPTIMESTSKALTLKRKKFNEACTDMPRVKTTKVMKDEHELPVKSNKKAKEKKKEQEEQDTQKKKKKKKKDKKVSQLSTHDTVDDVACSHIIDDLFSGLT